MCMKVDMVHILGGSYELEKKTKNLKVTTLQKIAEPFCTAVKNLQENIKKHKK